MARTWPLVLVLTLAACGQSVPTGDCLTDFDCERDQLCGAGGFCLLCENCDRGWIGTCTAPAFPLDREPDAVWFELSGLDELLVYQYRCPQGVSEFRYRRPDGQACFDTRYNLTDGCGLLLP